MIEHNTHETYDFCGEISEISQNTLSKSSPRTTFAGKTVKFPKYMNKMLTKYTDLITFGGGLLENKQNPYEGLVIETSNAQNAMFSFKTQPL